MKPTLYLMMGYPGAGKTTIAKLIADLTGAVYLSSDELRFEMFENPQFDAREHEALYKELDRRTQQLLEQRKSVVYDANLNRKIHRQEKYTICENTSAKPLLIWVKTPKDVAKDRVLSRRSNGLIPKNESAASMFERITEIIEEPLSDERPVVIEGIGVDERRIRQILDLR